MKLKDRISERAVSIRLPQIAYEKISAEARSLNMTVSSYVRFVLMTDRTKPARDGDIALAFSSNRRDIDQIQEMIDR